MTTPVPGPSSTTVRTCVQSIGASSASTSHGELGTTDPTCRQLSTNPRAKTIGEDRRRNRRIAARVAASTIGETSPRRARCGRRLGIARSPYHAVKPVSTPHTAILAPRRSRDIPPPPIHLAAARRRRVTRARGRSLGLLDRSRRDLHRCDRRGSRWPRRGRQTPVRGPPRATPMRRARASPGCWPAPVPPPARYGWERRSPPTPCSNGAASRSCWRSPAATPTRSPSAIKRGPGCSTGHIVKPAPLYADTIEIDERLAADGSVLRALDLEAARTALQAGVRPGAAGGGDRAAPWLAQPGA